MLRYPSLWINYAGGKLATQHIIEQGYQTSGITVGLPENRSANQRLKGWQDALQSAEMKTSLLRVIGRLRVALEASRNCENFGAPRKLKHESGA